MSKSPSPRVLMGSAKQFNPANSPAMRDAAKSVNNFRQLKKIN